MKIGADPEFEFFKDGQFVSAERVVRYNTHSKIGTDGASSTGEIRPAPGNPGDVGRHIEYIIGTIAKKYPQHDVYSGSGKTVPLGGHIHFSGFEHTPELLAALDKFIAIPLNTVSDKHVREGRYGRMSEVRPQPWGWEYRSPCSWLSHPYITKGALRIAWVLATASQQGKLAGITDVKKLLKYSKTIPAVEGSASVWSGDQTRWGVMLFYRTIERLKANNIVLEQIEVTKAWKKKTRIQPVQQPEPQQVNSILSAISWRNDDDYIPEIRAACEAKFREMAVGFSQESQVSVVGASENRAGNQVVFVNPNIVFSHAGADLNLPEGVELRLWDVNAIGLSMALRRDTEKAAKAVVEVLKNIEMPVRPQPAVDTESNRIYDIIEKGVR